MQEGRGAERIMLMGLHLLQSNAASLYSVKAVFPIDHRGIYSQSCINIARVIKRIAASSADDTVGLVVR